LRAIFSKSSVIFHIKLPTSVETSIMQSDYFKANSKKNYETEIHKTVTNWDSKLRKTLRRRFRSNKYSVLRHCQFQILHIYKLTKTNCSRA